MISPRNFMLGLGIALWLELDLLSDCFQFHKRDGPAPETRYGTGDTHRESLKSN